MLIELLEVSAEEARAETTLTRGAYVRLGWVRDIYEMRCQARRWIVAARAYLLHLVCCTLFANKSATYVHVVHLDVFRDLGQSGGYAWGVAWLVYCVLGYFWCHYVTFILVKIYCFVFVDKKNHHEGPPLCH